MENLPHNLEQVSADPGPVREVFNNAYLAQTAAGDLLVHSPPETLKHLFAKGLPVPKIVLLPQDIRLGEQLGSAGFVRQGINYASVEFLMYYNFFVAGGHKTRLITVTAQQARRIHQILKEVIEGPFHALPDKQFDWLDQECQAVAVYVPYGRAPVVEDLAEIRSLENGGGDLGDGVEIRFEGSHFVIREHGRVTCRVPTAITGQAIPLTLAPPRPLLHQEITLQFIGSSDGFDPNGITTCFLAYLGTTGHKQRQATLFDAAAYLRMRLGNLGISLSQISEVLLTHMHEDHMAGMSELLLMGERRLRVITSDLVYGSLLRILSAMMAVPEEEAAALFDFYPLNPGEPLELDGRRFEAIYAIHSIPTLAVNVGGLSYSGDMRYDESWFAELEQQGVLTAARRAELTNFAQNASVLIQDVGGGSIHTTLTSDVFHTLLAKSQHLILAHTSKPQLLAGEFGEEEWFGHVEFASAGLVTAIGESIERQGESELLETISACPLFSRLPLEERLALAEQVELTAWEPGQVIMSYDEPFDGKAYIVHRGLVEIWVEDKCILVLGRGSSVGERGAIKREPRTATVVARGEVEMISLDQRTFRTVAGRLNLAASFARAEWLWRHPKFRHLSWGTLLDLALDFEPREYQPGECLFKAGEVGHECFLLVSGEVTVLDENQEVVGTYAEPGEFLGGRTVLFGRVHRVTVCAGQKAEAWVLPVAALQRLQMVYPNVLLQLRAGDAP